MTKTGLESPDLSLVDLTGRRILLIMAGFFGYDREIVDRLVARGAVVTAYDDRPSKTNLTKVLARIHSGLVAVGARRHVEKIIRECRGQTFDDILVVKGEALSPYLLNKLFAVFANARTTFYMWDSFRNAKGSREKMASFDRCFTFDPIDAASTPGLKLRPLFFIPGYASPASIRPDIDVLFVGTVHTDRYKVLMRLARNLPSKVRRHYFLYFPARFIYLIRRCVSPEFWTAKSAEFSFKPLSHAENRSLYARALAIVDVERSVQTGLTMRTFEVLASGKKLITTNRSITSSELYDPDNVCVIDRVNPRISEEFLTQPFRPIDPAILHHYTLDNWIDEVIG